ncbi:MAG: hypothetical protein EOP31_29275 [Rhodococcus sp. (in: high G+C Gram-positive bacteria)]|uniref:hypothetical protein n=1 Tax=Rhodococcus sp. TaxID=1831 RepID=UPI0012031830|nr:hypothetical protein [Rhodococcus sp. (in: high G+C Gram-positive bacteria)]RZL21195.1 MAG: hypothetical protein EOP31_29275 [Rhodococcus sp. (in: high G+C Gram-positive bacteria)]
MDEAGDELHVLGSETAGRCVEALTIIVFGALCAVVAGSAMCLLIGVVVGLVRLVYLFARESFFENDMWSLMLPNVEWKRSRM